VLCSLWNRAGSSLINGRSHSEDRELGPLCLEMVLTPWWRLFSNNPQQGEVCVTSFFIYIDYNSLASSLPEDTFSLCHW
jgi:hypothetical protein